MLYFCVRSPKTQQRASPPSPTLPALCNRPCFPIVSHHTLEPIRSPPHHLLSRHSYLALPIQRFAHQQIPHLHRCPSPRPMPASTRPSSPGPRSSSQVELFSC